MTSVANCRPGRVAAGAVACALVALAGAGGARANGAFPDSQSVLVPADRPHEIVLATNFGVIHSEDDGNTWTWSCEQDPNGTRDLYQLGPPAKHRLYARDGSGLVFTDDSACTWAMSGTTFTDDLLVDAFPDPTDPTRVLGVAAPKAGTTTGPSLVVESADGGATFTTMRYTTATGVAINGIEISRSDPRTAYILTLTTSPFMSKLIRTADAGATWMEKDIGAMVGTGSVLLVGIDPTNPMRVFLRVDATGGDKLGITDDGGATVRTPLTFTGGFMSGFLRMATGTLLVSGVVGSGPVLYRSTDGGTSFQPVTGAPALWGLSERAGTIFGAGQTGGGAQGGAPFAIGTSNDEGNTWQPLLQFENVNAIDTCVKDACQDVCQNEASLGLWSPDVCSATAPPPHLTDGGTTSPQDASVGPGTGGAGGVGGSTGGQHLTGAGGGRPTSKGCSCSTPASAATTLPGLLALLALATLRRRRSR
jgi:MYXO-CTERM domain-containing protein